MKDIDETYSINIHGVVKNKITGIELIHGICNGYTVVCIHRIPKKLHRLLAKTFIPNPHKYRCINHIDGNKQNNDLSNLEWCDHSHNLQHAWDNNLRTWNPKSGRKSKFNKKQKEDIRLLKRSKTNKEIAQIYNCHTSIIQRITSGKTYI